MRNVMYLGKCGCKREERKGEEMMKEPWILAPNFW